MERIVQSQELIRSHNIHFEISLIFGLPLQTLASFVVEDGQPGPVPA